MVDVGVKIVFWWDVFFFGGLVGVCGFFGGVVGDCEWLGK